LELLKKKEDAYPLYLASSTTAMGLLVTLFSNGFWTG
jgi:hypothetical protein